MARLAEEEKERKRLAEEERQKLIDQGLWDPDDDAEEGEKGVTQLNGHLFCAKGGTTDFIWISEGVAWMDGWMDGWIWMNGWMDGWMDDNLSINT